MGIIAVKRINSILLTFFVCMKKNGVLIFDIRHFLWKNVADTLKTF